MHLTRQQIDEMIEHARTDYPNEACGVLAGHEGRVTRVYRGTNVDTNPELRYHLDPERQLGILRDIEHNGWKLLAIYHTHPQSPAYPSQIDVQMAYYPDAVSIIISLMESPPEIRAFRIVNDTIIEEQLEIT